MKKLISVLIFIIAFGAAQQGVRFLFNQYEYKTYTQESLESEFETQFPELIFVLKKDFPNDYNQIITNTLAAINNGGKLNNISARIASIIAETRRKYADQVIMAPDENLKTILLNYIDFHEMIKSKDSKKLCASVAFNGPAVIPATKTNTYLGALDRIGASTFKAIRAALDTPVQRSLASDQDWSRVGEEMVRNGASTDLILVFTQANWQDERYCDATLYFLNAMHDLTAPSGERVRAMFVGEIVKS